MLAAKLFGHGGEIMSMLAELHFTVYTGAALLDAVSGHPCNHAGATLLCAAHPAVCLLKDRQRRDGDGDAHALKQRLASGGYGGLGRERRKPMAQRGIHAVRNAVGPGDAAA
ncbi:hypothetical protein [Streptomyces hygroscopicus]|uniref:hypothetical protein n=1 Tax=Streptomyces hygroscopicus TaxID=1912 RepID=UPI0013316F51|nr:hypothetical protein [Streptomyces hygroscopicus]